MTKSFVYVDKCFSFHSEIMCEHMYEHSYMCDISRRVKPICYLLL